MYSTSIVAHIEHVVGHLLLSSDIILKILLGSVSYNCTAYSYDTDDPQLHNGRSTLKFGIYNGSLSLVLYIFTFVILYSSRLQ